MYTIQMTIYTDKALPESETVHLLRAVAVHLELRGIQVLDGSHVIQEETLEPEEATDEPGN